MNGRYEFDDKGWNNRIWIGQESEIECIIENTNVKMLMLKC